jgi:hypothetical protein
MTDTNERPNWDVNSRFEEACKAADAIHVAVADFKTADTNKKDVICRALCETLRLIEDWKGDHRPEISTKLGLAYPDKGEDAVLPVVKRVLREKSKNRWTWYANALRQALADERTSDNLTTYFIEHPVTTMATKWAREHPTKPKRDPITVPIECELPPGIKITEEGTMVRLCQRDGRPALEIQQKAP